MADQRCYLKAWLQSFLPTLRNFPENKPSKPIGRQMPSLSVNFRAQGCDPYRKGARLTQTSLDSQPCLQVSLYWLTFPILSDRTDLPSLSQAACHGNTGPANAALNSNSKQGRATENGKCQKATALTATTPACTWSLMVKGNTPCEDGNSSFNCKTNIYIITLSPSTWRSCLNTPKS